MRYSFVAGLLGLLGLWGQQALAQAPDTTVYPPTLRPVPVLVPEPVWLLNGQLIIGETVLTDLDPQVIQRIEVYKGGLGTPARWRSLAAHGLLALTMKPDFKLRTIASKSQEQLQRELRLAGPVQFAVEGLPLQDPALRIAAAAIAGLDVREAAGQTPVVNIRLLRRPPQPVPPGTIRIRGVAQR